MSFWLFDPLLPAWIVYWPRARSAQFVSGYWAVVLSVQSTLSLMFPRRPDPEQAAGVNLLSLPVERLLSRESRYPSAFNGRTLAFGTRQQKSGYLARVSLVSVTLRWCCGCSTSSSTHSSISWRLPLSIYYYYKYCSNYYSIPLS